VAHRANELQLFLLHRASGHPSATHGERPKSRGATDILQRNIGEMQSPTWSGCVFLPVAIGLTRVWKTQRVQRIRASWGLVGSSAGHLVELLWSAMSLYNTGPCQGSPEGGTVS
jgi:hypothetical protein